MRFFISSAIFLVLALSFANAQTTLTPQVVVDGQAWELVWQNGTYDSLEATIESNDVPWWGQSDTADSFATAANVNGLRFAFLEADFSGSDTVLYFDNNGQTQVFQTTQANWVINATAVPAPLPILGILPVVGFLKRMRKRQRA